MLGYQQKLSHENKVKREWIQRMRAMTSQGIMATITMKAGS
jgi:hypothetical protein